MTKPPDHWNKHAAQWDWIGSPLRPDLQDIQMAGQALRVWEKTKPGRAPQALLLGVTPELAIMDWPSGTQLIAVDHSRAMIGGVWRSAVQESTAVCANWTALPLPNASRDFIAGDGCFSALSFPGQYRAMVAELRRVIREDGMLLMRFFTRPAAPEAVTGVFDDLIGGRIGNFHAFKWRLAMALHGTLDVGVRLADIWDAWHQAVPAPDQLASSLGWPLQSVLTIDAYRGVDTRYTFPTLVESRAALAGTFAEVECRFPSYELGDRCPTLMFRPR
jgi:SAM-dependent methyltransferase